MPAATAATPLLGLHETCAKLGLAFWDSLGARFAAQAARKSPPSPKLSAHAPQGHPNLCGYLPLLMKKCLCKAGVSRLKP